MAIIIEKGNAVSVDHNNYDLSLDQAAVELSKGRNVVAREFEDFSLDDDDCSFPEVDVLEARDYAGMNTEQIIESIRGYYESFGKSE